MWNANSPDSNMPEDRGDKGMAEGVDTMVRHTFTKQRHPRATLELSYDQPNQPSQQDHALSYPQPKAEELLAEEQAKFRSGRSIVGKIFNSRVIMEKPLQHQRDRSIKS